MAAYDGNGNYVRSYSWVQDASNGIAITASRFDTEMNGEAAALSICVTRDGQGRMAADFLPGSTLSYNLGSAARSWLNMTAQSVTTLSGAVGPPAAGTAWTVTAVAGSYATLIIGANSSGNSYGLIIQAGFTSADAALAVENHAGTGLFVVYGDGGATVGAPTGGTQGLGSINAQTLFTNGNPVYAGIPQNLQAVSYVTVLADANKHIAVSTNSKTVTIAANASVAYPIGTAITVLAEPGVTGTQIAINSDTLTWAQGGGTGTRSLAAAGVATLLKYAATAWIISGTGLT